MDVDGNRWECGSASASAANWGNSSVFAHEIVLWEISAVFLPFGPVGVCAPRLQQRRSPAGGGGGGVPAVPLPIRVQREPKCRRREPERLAPDGGSGALGCGSRTDVIQLETRCRQGDDTPSLTQKLSQILG
eukprot:gene25206-biopygen23969